MGRITALIVKDLREHYVAAIALLVVEGLGLAFMLLLLVGAARQNTTALFPYTLFLWSFLPVAAIVLGNRLVVAEYYGRTQLFLEALPIRRWEMIAVKYLLGLLVLLLIAFGALSASAVVASFNEPVGLKFLAIMGVRSAALVFFMWSWLFAMGFTGRYRTPIYLGIAISLMALGTLTDLQLNRFGPVAVAHVDTLHLERNVLPTAAVLETLAIGGAWVALAFVLGLINEGSLAETLCKRMSQKEKSLVGVLFVGLLIGFTFLDQKKTKAPLKLGEDEVFLKSDSHPLEILYLHKGTRADAQDLLDHLDADLTGLKDALGWETIPPLRIAMRETLDGATFEQATLEDNDGVLVRANFRRTNEWQPRACRAYALACLLREVTKERAEFEPQAWVLDGFARWWCERDEQASPTSLPLLRAVWATEGVPLTPEGVTRWFRMRERHGRPVAEGIAYAGIVTLERLQGRDRVLALARALYGREIPEDSRETLRTWSNPFTAVFEEATAQPWPRFVAAWSAEIDRLRSLPEVQAALAQVPRGTATLEVRSDVGVIRHLDYALTFDRPPKDGAVCSLAHLPLTPFDHPLDPRTYMRTEHGWPAGVSAKTYSLLGRYGQGSRIFVAVEIQSEILGCPLRLLAERRVIE